MGANNDNFVGYYNQFKNKIFVYFLYRVNFNREVAEDLTSEIFLKALKNFDSYKQERSFQAWIFAIAHNHLVNYYRIAGRESYPLAENYSEGSGLDKVEITYELDLVFKKIKSMEPADRDVLLLRFVDQLTNSEIADVLGKNEGAIRTSISRSLKKLRGELDNNG